ncbi:MAG: hypothetical protein KIC73_01185 [Clostridiales bacterium]|jgi:hypothetical protein|nr:hypothetical protein [Clostridiales bacterium]
MKLNDLYKMPIGDALGQMDILDMKVHTDDVGEIKTVEIKYQPVPSDVPVSTAKTWN